jgi:ferredoxin-NADP reductase
MKHAIVWHSATVRAHRDLTPTVREFELLPDRGVASWSVGAHINVAVQVDGKNEVRSYSLVGLPARSMADGVYRIAVKRAQPGQGGSRFMWNLSVGDTLNISKPSNHFELTANLTEHALDYLLIAGGIGITPMLGMAQRLAARGAKVQMRYAARSTAELAYLEELRTALGTDLQVFCDDAGQQIDLDFEIAALPARGQLWMCGPLALLDAARAAWARAGRAAADLRFETFGNSGQFEAQAFWVEIPRHQLRLEVPANRSLLSVLEQAGVQTLYECERGECGLCAMDVVSVSGTVDHRDVFFSAHEKLGNQRLCACVSRVHRAGGGAQVVLDSAYRADG